MRTRAAGTETYQTSDLAFVVHDEYNDDASFTLVLQT